MLGPALIHAWLRQDGRYHVSASLVVVALRAPLRRLYVGVLLLSGHFLPQAKNKGRAPVAEPAEGEHAPQDALQEPHEREEWCALAQNRVQAEAAHEGPQDAAVARLAPLLYLEAKWEPRVAL
jgi:hypothetical protein